MGVIIYTANKDNGLYQASSAGDYVPGKVLEVISDNTEPDYEKSEGLRIGSQIVKVEITSGEHKGEVHEITNNISMLYNVHVNKGTRVMLLVTSQSNGSYNVSIYAYDRSIILIGSVLVFALALCVIGGKKGVKAVLGLAFTLICMMFILIPLISKGWNATGLTIGLVILTTIVSFIVLEGITIKTISAMFSTIIGVCFSGLFSIFVENAAHINGYNMEEAENLLLISGSTTTINIKGLLTAGILIASLGAVMDVAMSISSAVYEIYRLNQNLSFKELFTSGMNVGRDAMGTMANTLILAFAGSSLNLLLLVFAYKIPFFRFINTDMIAVEILRGVAGSLGIICAVPIAAVVIPFIVKVYIKK